MNHFERFDPQSGILMPWYTYGSLDEILTWDLSGKVVLEYGGGHSTRWWANKAKHVYTVESDRSWYATISSFSLENSSLELRDKVNAGEYVRVPDGCAPDIVAIDGEHRRECLAVALMLPRPLTIVHDNWQQDFVYVDEVAEAMMSHHPGHFYVQPDHRNHAGRPWQTAIWYLGRDEG